MSETDTAQADERTGEFDFDDPRFQADPWPVYAWYRRHQPVHWSQRLQSYVLVGYEHARRALTSAEFGVFHPFRTSRRAFGASMLDTDGPAHADARRCASGVLRPRGIPELTERVIAPAVAAVLDEELPGCPADLAQRLATVLPMRVVCQVMGLPAADAPWLYDMMRPLVRYVDHHHVPLAEVAERRQELVRYLRDALPCAQHGLLASLRSEPRLGESGAVNNSILLLAAGTETTAAGICNLLARVAAQPDLFRRAAADRGLVAGIVAETLRHEPPLHVTLRFAVAEITVAGTTLPAGAPVQVCLASGNRDPAMFPEPDRWQLRPSGRTPLTFGAGRHTCLGLGLAHAELEVLLEGLLDRVRDIGLDGPEPVVRGRAFRAAADLRLGYRLGDVTGTR